VDYQERDLVVKVLTREGEKLGLFVYGGQGGGKKLKPKVFEPGSLLKIFTQDSSHRSGDDQLKIVKESSPLWQPEKIRHQAMAFYIQCFYLEVLNKVAVDTSGPHALTSPGLFNVLANALFYLDKASHDPKPNWIHHLALFQVKLLHHLGIFPQMDNCHEILKSHQAWLIQAEGGFACLNCVDQEVKGREPTLFSHLKKAYQTRYEDYRELGEIPVDVVKEMFSFLLFHLQLKEKDFRTLTMIFGQR
jgi:DNA repair protein RecO